jgi:hypothetical protein
VPVDLSGACNHDGIATAAHPDDGNFDGGGWSYPAEELSPAGAATLAGTPMEFPSGADGELNTIEADGQSVALPALQAKMQAIPLDAGKAVESLTPPGAAAPEAVRDHTRAGGDSGGTQPKRLWLVAVEVGHALLVPEVTDGERRGQDSSQPIPSPSRSSP